MERTLKISREYDLGRNKSVWISDEISNISEELFLNPKAMSIIRNLQLLQIDSGYFEYVTSSPTFIEGLKPEEALKLINDVKAPLIEELKEATARLNTNTQE